MALRGIFAVVFIAFLSGCERKTNAKGPPPQPKIKQIEAEAVRRDTMRRDIEVVGTLAAQDEVTISSQSEGLVLKILADLGDVVKAGQPLVELDSEKLRYSLEQQQAALNRALVKYGASGGSELPAEKDTPDARRAEAELEQAARVRQRARELWQAQLIAKQALEEAEANFQTKQAVYDLALQNARNSRADINVADAATKLAARLLRDSIIYAPFDAYVQKRMVVVGQLVGAQTPVMTLVKVGALKIVAEIPERMAPWIKLNQTVSFQADAFPDRSFGATITRISPAVNTQTRSFSFEAVTPNEKQLLKPGTFARVHVETALTEQALTIPAQAVQYRFGVSRAFVVASENTLSVRELKLGDRHGDRVEIVDGLKEGDIIAVTDIDNLADGMKIMITHGAG